MGFRGERKSDRKFAKFSTNWGTSLGLIEAEVRAPRPVVRSSKLRLGFLDREMFWGNSKSLGLGKIISNT